MRSNLGMQHLLLLCGLGCICQALPQQFAAQTSQLLGSQRAGRKLTGKFLHITDIHPDPYFKTYASTDDDKACHRGTGPAGYYGAETSDCDSPIHLLDATFKWINETIRDDIDFVIWTGDSARHDNDERIPRSETQVVSQNELVVSKIFEVFGKPDRDDDLDPTNDLIVPVVPTLGNNDILPHNIFEEGPNKWTREYLRIWRSFIPEEQRHQFAQGGWFHVEVIPNKLAVISLNTLYFFDSNSAVDGCALRSEPGYQHFEWLRIQLQILRSRGMKAMLMGHVPPARVDSKMSWDETCWQKYTLWQRQYRDVIVGNFFGHMNLDHFMLQDFKEIKKDMKNGYGVLEAGAKAKYAADEDFTTMSATDYLSDLRDVFAKIPAIKEKFLNPRRSADGTWLGYLASIYGAGKETNPMREIGGEFGQRYSLSFVAPSVVPNYLPTIRVFEYNITGLDNLVAASPSLSKLPSNQDMQESVRNADVDTSEHDIASDSEAAQDLLDELTKKKKRKHKKNKKNKKKKQSKKYKFKVPKGPSKSSPPGPAYSPQTLSLLGYTQFYANLSHINNDFINAAEEDNDDNIDDTRYFDDDEELHDERWKSGKHSGKTKKGKPHPKKFKFKVEYNTLTDKVFGLKDLTVRSYIDLAKKIGNSQKAASSEMREEYADDSDDDGGDGDDDDLGEVDAEKKKKKKKGKKKHGKKVNRTWHAFIKRAFVGTVSPDEIDERFELSDSIFEAPSTGNSTSGGSAYEL